MRILLNSLKNNKQLTTIFVHGTTIESYNGDGIWIEIESFSGIKWKTESTSHPTIINIHWLIKIWKSNAGVINIAIFHILSRDSLIQNFIYHDEKWPRDKKM
jgi:hypothetical protein